MRDIYFYSDVPDQLKGGQKEGGQSGRSESLREVVAQLVGRLMASNCNYFSVSFFTLFFFFLDNYCNLNV